MEMHTLPVQKVGQASFKAVPAPWASHAERYGVRTASGTEAGLKGVALHVTAAATGASKRDAALTRRAGTYMVVLRDAMASGE